MTKRYKIILFTCELINPGGHERLMIEEAKYLEKKGHEARLLTFKLDRKALFGHSDINLEVLNSKSRIDRTLLLRKRLKELKPNLVIAQSYWDAEVLYLATLFTGISYITHIHGTPFWFDNRLDLRKYGLIFRKSFNEIRNSLQGHKEFIPANPKISLVDYVKLNIFAFLNYLAVRKSKVVITLTDQLKWEIKKMYGIDAIVSRGCLDSEVFNYKPKRNIRKELGLEGKQIILNIGRLDPRKRIDVLIKAFSKICRKYDDVFLLIGGVGEDEKKLKKLAKDLNVEDRVIFLGYIPEKDLFDYYSACDVFAFPSWTTSGITPYEALAVGKKVVWTSEADEPVLSDKHVFVADPTVDGFAKALEKALNTKIEGQIDLSQYTWDKYFERVYKACIDVLEGNYEPKSKK